MTTVREITNAWVNRTLPDVFYEEPEPVEDGMQQEIPIDHIKRLLWVRYGERDDVFITNAVFIMYDRTNGNRRVQPDCMIVFDVDPAIIRERLPNYWIWEVGKPPDFVMEVASPSTAANDLGHKRDLYASLGIMEYWRFDPTGGELYGQPMTGERLVDGGYEPYELDARPDGVMVGSSQLLGVDFSWDGSRFDVLDPDTGNIIDRYARDLALRLGIEAQRDAAEARADSEREARLAAEARARELEDELRRLRGA